MGLHEKLRLHVGILAGAPLKLGPVYFAMRNTDVMKPDCSSICKQEAKHKCRLLNENHGELRRGEDYFVKQNNIAWAFCYT